MHPIRRHRIRRNQPETLEQRALLSTITVTSLEDNMTVDGQVTLREALEAANTDKAVDGSTAGDGADTIRFAPELTGRVFLDEELGSLTITDDTTIIGNGRGATRVSAQGANIPVIEITEGLSLTIKRLGLQNGAAGLRSTHRDATLTLFSTRVADNKIGVDVAAGSATINRTIVAGNRQGVNARQAQLLTIKDRQIINNRRSRGSSTGAGIYLNNTKRTEITNSEIVGNTLNLNGYGAGLYGIGDSRDSVTVLHSTIGNNSVSGDDIAFGGGVYLAGMGGHILNTQVSGNTVSAAEVLGAGVAMVHSAGVSPIGRITDSRVHNNTATGTDAWGGAIYNDSFRLNIERSSVYSNAMTGTESATGAVFAFDNDFRLYNSTISNNEVNGSDGIGAAVTVRRARDLDIRSSTILGDGSGVSVTSDSWWSDIFIYSSVISSGGPDLRLSLHPQNDVEIQHNFISSNALSGLDAAPPTAPDADGNMIGPEEAPIDPMLGPLDENGGPSPTHKPLAGSPLIDAGINPVNREFYPYRSFATDQRGEPFSRESGPMKLADIGAIEAGDAFVEVTATTPRVPETAGSVTFEVRLATPMVAPVTLDYATVDGQATAGEDFIPTSGQLTFDDGSEVLSVTVPVLDDDLPEWAETFSLEFSHSDLLVVSNDTPVTIAADDDRGLNVTRSADGVDGGNDVLIRATEADDIITIEPVANAFEITWNGQQQSVADDNITRFFMLLDDGDNQLNASAVSQRVVVRTGDGRDTIETGSGDDWVRGGDQADIIRAGAGHDSVEGGRGRDLLEGGDGNDTLWGNESNDTLHGGDGNDWLRDGAGNDRIFGMAGDDRLLGGTGRDLMEAGPGADYVSTGSGRNTVRGGSGDDRLFSNSNDLVTGGSGDDHLEQDALNALPTLRGSSGKDTLFAYQGEIDGGEGSDTISVTVRTAGVIAYGGPGDDVMRARLSGETQSVTLVGGTGNDRLIADHITAQLDGGEGNDVLLGSAHDDTLLGGMGRDRLNGKAGNDSLDGGVGDDILLGGEGQDTLEGQEGHDIISGEAGPDIINGMQGQDILVGGGGTDTLTGHAGEDIVVGGSTTLNRVALGEIRKEWTSARDQTTRADNIRGGSGSEDRANGDSFLNATTLTDDAAADDRLGSEDSDWFFARAATDVLGDKLETELFDEV